MKNDGFYIKEIRWKNHPVLGDICLDFSTRDCWAYKTIVIAGENGAGKTAILDSVYNLINYGNLEYIAQFRYIKNGVTYNLVNDVEYTLFNEKSKREANKQVKSINVVLHDKTNFNILYSHAGVGFKTNEVEAARTDKIEEYMYEIDKNQDPTLLKQLLIDIYFQDLLTLDKLVNNDLIDNIKDWKNNSNIARFKTAFNSFFNDIKFKGLDDSKKSEINCLFEKNSKTFTIDNLSSGEKQIVFRGTYLLKNINHMDNCVVLIDEPELSMHPKWQQKILKYYRDLYSNTNNEIQMIFATHSDEVVKSAYDNNNSLVIILKKDKDGNLSVINTSESKFVLPRLSSAEINYRTFGTFAIEYHILLYGYLQCLKKLDRIKECDDFIYKKIIDKKNNYDDINEYIIIDEYDKSKTEYKTLPTYIRNSINHPNDKRKFTAEMLDNSIKLLINLIKNCK